jgi:hypothetical protein
MCIAHLRNRDLWLLPADNQRPDSSRIRFTVAKLSATPLFMARSELRQKLGGIDARAPD